MARFTVEMRTAQPLASLAALDHVGDAKRLVGNDFDATTAHEAVVDALRGLPEDAEVELFYVPGEDGKLDVFWPDAEPMSFESGPTPAVQMRCFLMINEMCLFEGIPADGDVFVVGPSAGVGGQWVCPPCESQLAQRS